MQRSRLLKTSILSAGLLLSLAACSSTNNNAVNEAIQQRGQYWQRIKTSSALYMQGPKAQQMLNRDIARCVTELKELERLGQIKNAIPTYTDQNLVMTKDEAEMAGWDVPERDEYLLTEQTPYHDFESCMYVKGWERVRNVSYSIDAKSRETYLRNNVNTVYKVELPDERTIEKKADDKEKMKADQAKHEGGMEVTIKDEGVSGSTGDTPPGSGDFDNLNE